MYSFDSKSKHRDWADDWGSRCVDCGCVITEGIVRCEGCAEVGEEEDQGGEA